MASEKTAEMQASTNCGVPELIAESEESYIIIAVNRPGTGRDSWR